MKKLIVFLLILLLTGCTEDKLTLEKDDYLVYKEELLKQEDFTKEEELLFDLNLYADKVSEEEINYRAIIDNPKENMHNIKAIVLHNHFTDSIFPSIGIFNDPIELEIGNEEVKGITLTGYIKTTKEIEELNLELRIYVEYTTDDNETRKIYYKTTI